MSRCAKPTQRQRIEALLIERGEHGIHSFELYRMHLPRGAVVVDRLRKAGWPIESVDEPSPTGGQGVRYILRSLPAAGHQQPQQVPLAHVAEAAGAGRDDNDAEQLPLVEPPASPRPQTAIFDWDEAA